MTFLAPVAGLIGAAIGVPLLVALYLLKLRRKPLKVSSTLLWEQAVQDLQANVPLRWLKWSWMLLLQLAALACLLVALARPAIPGTAGVGARTIIVIDRSASMNAGDGVGASPGSARFTRLDQAKRQALELVEQMRRAPGVRARAMVIALGAEARTVCGFTSDARDLRDAIESIQPTDQPADLAAVVQIVAAAASAGSEGETGGDRTTLVLLSDGSLEPGRERLPGSVDLRLVQVGPVLSQGAVAPPLPDNLGIVSLSARRDTENPATARVFVRVINSGPKPISTTLTCAVDGESAGMLPLDLPAATIGQSGAAVAGEAAGTIEIERPAGGVFVVTLARPDLLREDNSAAVVLSRAAKPRVLIIGPNEPGDPYAAARGPLGIDRFLLGVLEDLEPGELRTIDAAAYRAEASAARSPGQRGFGEYDLIIFDRVRPTDIPTVPTIHIGAGAPIAGLTVGPIAPPAASSSATRFISWKRSHPIMRSTALDAVMIAPPMRMTIDEAAAARPDAPTITPLAFGIDGPLIALVQEPGVRGVKRLVLAMDLARTNWGKDVSFPVFISSAVDVLTGRGEASASRSFTTGQSISVIASPGVRRLNVTGPEAFTIDLPGDTRRDAAAVSLGIPRLAGVYSIEGAEPADRRIAVNIASARESALAVHASVEIGGREVRAGAERGGEPPRREVWHWFVLIACALLTIEWFVYAWRSKP